MGCASSSAQTGNAEAAPAAAPEPAATAPPVAKTQETAPASTVNFKPIHSAIRWNKLPINEIEALLKSDEEVNIQDPDNGNYAIHIAAQNGHLDIIELLLKKHVLINTQNMKGNTALHMAIGYDYYEVAMALLNAGADPLIINEAGFPGKTGLEGDKTIGIAALICAKNREEVTAALATCENEIADLNKGSFVTAGLKTKKAIGAEWTDEIKDKFRNITMKLP